jgi:hypothetical protein
VPEPDIPIAIEKAHWISQAGFHLGWYQGRTIQINEISMGLASQALFCRHYLPP